MSYKKGYQEAETLGKNELEKLEKFWKTRYEKLQD
jgi:hypothetical protein